MINPSVQKSLGDALERFNYKNATHGENWREFGEVMKIVLPNFPVNPSVEDLNRLGLFIQILGKVMRYGKTFSRGGCKDSAGDLVTYAAMLDSLTEEPEAATGDIPDPYYSS